ncbi:MAG: 50S ribosomal protein L25 [Candidatus Gracilibacteria bacterium]|jgi:large subunit ribosomal protein L25
MENIILEAQTRDLNKKASAFREEGFIPAEFYGKGIKNQSVLLKYQDFRKAYKAAGKNTIIQLVVDGKGKINVLVNDVKYHPVTDIIEHVDFINVNMSEEIHTIIPLVFTGVSPAVKDSAGTLITNLEELKVKCLPKDLIPNIEVSIVSLVDFHSTIHVKDLNVPATIHVLNNPEDLVAMVAAHREEKEEAPVVAAVEGTPAEGVAATADGKAPEAGK